MAHDGGPFNKNAIQKTYKYDIPVETSPWAEAFGFRPTFTGSLAWLPGVNQRGLTDVAREGPLFHGGYQAVQVEFICLIPTKSLVKAPKRNQKTYS